jgi:hypothetical protein
VAIISVNNKKSLVFIIFFYFRFFVAKIRINEEKNKKKDKNYEEKVWAYLQNEVNEHYIHPVCGLQTTRLNASFDLRNNEFRKTPNLLPQCGSNVLVERD